MTRRTIQAGDAPTVVIRAGGSVRVTGWDDSRVQAETADRWGLKLEARGGAIEVTAGGTCTVRVPRGSTLKIHAGKAAEVRQVAQVAAANAGTDLALSAVERLSSANAGRHLHLDCRAVIGPAVKFTAGQDIRCHIRGLANARLLVTDQDGHWEQQFGEPETSIRLVGGGAARVVTTS